MTILKIEKNPIIVTFECNYCKQIYTRNNVEKPILNHNSLKKEKHYCSTRCAYDDRERKTEIEGVCDFCGKKYLKYKCLIKNKMANHCSEQCYYNNRSKNSIYHKNLKFLQTDEARLKSKETIKRQFQTGERIHPLLGKHHSQETKDKISKEHIESGRYKGERNHMFGKKHSQETREKMSEIVSNEIVSKKRKVYGNNHIIGKHLSIKNNKEYSYRSSWERSVMIWLDSNQNVVTYEYETVKIKYYDNEGARKHSRNYIPDFLIEFSNGEKELWELKPKQFIESMKNIAKAEAAVEWCKENNIQTYVVLTKDDLIEKGILQK